MPPTTSRSFDPLLLAEVVLVLVLIGLGVVFYLRPAANNLPDTRWWQWVLLAALFFGVVALDGYRRTRGSRRALRDTLAGEEPEDRTPPRD
jgi:hypothetical protein